MGIIHDHGRYIRRVSYMFMAVISDGYHTMFMAVMSDGYHTCSWPLYQMGINDYLYTRTSHDE